ncbi:MAG: PQQ-binding-like beta-propeller repeat protein [Syntrophomonas sp.]|nr:PQQ-binding-like beta-propeller repeat protein [Syntrophomonas sp.]
MIRGFCGRIKIALFMIFFLLLAYSSSSEAASKLEQFPAAKEAGQPGQLLWKLSGLGKLSTDIVFAPNGNLLFPSNNKLICINPEGKLIWEMQGKGKGSLGSPVLTEDGAIFFAGGSVIQEGKLNGALGWDFSVYGEGKGQKTPLLAHGPGNILYLPLSDALYAVDTVGHYVWMLSPWESSDGRTSKLINPRTFLACTADEQAFYLVFGDKAGNYKLAAINAKGEYLWKYWLGDISSAYLLTDNEGKLYASVNFKKGSRGNKGSKLNQGKVYCFKNSSGNSPLWSSSFSVANQITAPVLGNSKTLYFTGGNKLYALDTEKGKVLWDTPLLKLVSTPAVSPNGYIYGGSSDGYFFAVKPSGRLAWFRQLDGAVERAPLVGTDNFIYVHTGKGNLYKIKDNFKES